jgi:translation initiation factor 3 subunit L
MYGLLCLIQQVAPGMSLSGIVQKRIDQKFGDKIQRVRRGDDTAFDELFEFSAPNFITATPPDYTKYINHNQFAKRQQSLPFLNEIKARRDINKISSSIKFYTTVTIAKLATLLDTTESALRERLMFIKYKTLYDMSGESGSVELKGETKM